MMMMLLLIVLLMLLRGLVSLDRFPLNLSHESTLSLHLVRYDPLVTVGIDQIVLTLGFISRPGLLLPVDIPGVVIVDSVRELVVSGCMVFFFVVMVVFLLLLWLIVHLLRLNLLDLDLLLLDLNLLGLLLVDLGLRLVLEFFLLLHLRLLLVAIFWLHFDLLLKVLTVITDTTLGTGHRRKC